MQPSGSYPAVPGAQQASSGSAYPSPVVAPPLEQQLGQMSLGGSSWDPTYQPVLQGGASGMPAQGGYYSQPPPQQQSYNNGQTATWSYPAPPAPQYSQPGQSAYPAAPPPQQQQYAPPNPQDSYTQPNNGSNAYVYPTAAAGAYSSPQYSANGAGQGQNYAGPGVQQQNNGYANQAPGMASGYSSPQVSGGGAPPSNAYAIPEHQQYSGNSYAAIQQPPLGSRPTSPPAGPMYPTATGGMHNGQACYGHLQHAPSFNQASATNVAQVTPEQLPPGYTAPIAGWVLEPKFPGPPTAQISGPYLRFNDYDPITCLFETSVLVVVHPSVTDGTVQVHYAVNAPASQAASGQLLDEFMGYKFVRFDVCVSLTDAPSVCNYMVGLRGASAPIGSYSFHLPARTESWRWFFYSCNGFHEDASHKLYNGIEHLWKDCLVQHQQRPFHLQVGGGDQLYNDHVLELPALKPWLSILDPHARAKVALSPGLLMELEQYYFAHYLEHFAEKGFATALATIPYCFIWDDHDVFDGWGSYPDYLQHSPVFQGMFAVARRFFLLFQMHCNYASATTISKTIGDFSYHQVRNVGADTMLLVPDTRSQRSPHVIVPKAGWDQMFAEVERRLSANPSVRHLGVVLTVPIIYPKIPLTERVLGGISGAIFNNKFTRESMNKISGSMPSGAMSVFNEPDLLDDLRDHWTAADHMEERAMLVRALQGMALRHGVRVTFLSGDVHLGAFGCFQAHPKVHDKLIDNKYMLQVVSSAMGNEPPPAGVVKTLEVSSCAETTMQDTLSKMIKTFPEGNTLKKLRGARNYCIVEHCHQDIRDAHTGHLHPPGGLSFTLRIEMGPPGKPTGVEAFTQVAPVLLINGHMPGQGGYGAVGAATSTFAQATGLKTLGHKLSNFMGKV